jgi:hypothetical protein
MTDNNPGQDTTNGRDTKANPLDHELDTALAKYAAIEPRQGLEERILANLKSEQERAAHSWWRWPAVAALAAVIVMALSLAWRSRHSTENTAAQHPMHSNEHAGTQVANNAGSGSIPPHDAPRKPTPHTVFRPAAVVARAPKLDQFPSPQPLSEQEKMLTEYVAQHHQQAVLVARARMVELKQDLAKEMEEAAATSNRQTSDQSASQEDRSR